MSQGCVPPNRLPALAGWAADSGGGGGGAAHRPTVRQSPDGMCTMGPAGGGGGGTHPPPLHSQRIVGHAGFVRYAGHGGGGGGGGGGGDGGGDGGGGGSGGGGGGGCTGGTRGPMHCTSKIVM